MSIDVHAIKGTTMKRSLIGFRSVTCVALAALLFGNSAVARGQDREGDRVQRRIEISHADSTVRLRTFVANRLISTEPQHGSIEPEGEIRLRHPRTAHVRITDTNSALYTCKLETTKSVVPEVEETKRFLALLGPYATDLAATLTSRPFFKGVAPVDTAGQIIEPAQGYIDELQTQVNELTAVHARTIAALEEMRRMTTDSSPERIAQGLRDDIGSACVNPADCRQLAAVNSIVHLLPKLAEARQDLGQRLARMNPTDPRAETLRKIASDAEAVLKGANDLIAAAYATEFLTATVASAKSIIDCGVLRVTPTSGRDIVVNVSANTLPEIRRVASRPPLEVKAKVLPRLIITPAVGVSLLVAPGASFANFAAIKAPGDSAEIIRSGTQDSRFTYGLTLAARWPTETPVGRLGKVSLFLPELTINPSSDIRAFGLGGGIGVGIIKIGTGLLWTRHTVLEDGQEVGTRLRDAAFLQKRNTYELDDPNWYFSFSIIGWPPFLSQEEKK